MREGFDWQLEDGHLSFYLLLSLLLHGVVLLVNPLSVSGRAATPNLVVQLSFSTVRSETSSPSTAPEMPPKQISAEPKIGEGGGRAERISASDLPPSVGSVTYFALSSLSVRPQLLNPEFLDELAWRLPVRARGAVALAIEIDAFGHVDAIEIESGAAGSEVAEWMVELIRNKARFAPGEIGDFPVPSRMRIYLDLREVVQ